METDHIKMLCDIGELSGVFDETTIEECMHKTVAMIASHMAADVSSLYLYDEETGELVLRATEGLQPAAVNTVRMQPGEGLVGLAFRELRPVNERVGKENPHFRFYPGIDEDRYDAFLAVPLMRGKSPIGVLTVQRGGGRAFGEQDVLALRTTASQIAATIEHVKILLPIQVASRSARFFDFAKHALLRGKSASGGWTLAPVAVAHGRHDSPLFPEGADRLRLGIADFDRALAQTEQQLEELQLRVEEKLSDAASLIFASHLFMLKDGAFRGSMRELIEKGTHPLRAIETVFEKYRLVFSRSDNGLVREKVQDIEDLCRRLVGNLVESRRQGGAWRGRVIVAREMFPSDLLTWSAEEIAGIVLVSGGITSHVSILARSLDIPLVFIDEPALLDLPDDTEVLLDADSGTLYIRPVPEVAERFRERDRAAEAFATMENEFRGPLRTADGTRVDLQVNINLLSELKHLEVEEIDGVGLYRTEFPFLIRSTFPSEEEQLFVYARLVAGLGGKPVTFRTLDIGGDKVLSYYDFPEEENPFLGMRSIRFSLTHRDIFRQQVRAILRAGAASPLRIMFPMISSVEEFLDAREVVEQAMEELRIEGIAHNEDPAIGMMVEIPSAVNVIEDLAELADFFSIGTNDLIQYTLAVDRTNEKVASLYIPHHPAVLRSLKRIADAGHAAGIPVSICGDMGSDDRYIPFLLGIGITSLSVDSMYVPRVKKWVSGLTMTRAREVAADVLAQKKLADIEERIKSLT